MGNPRKIAELLSPLIDDVAREMEGREPHDPLALVQERLVRLIHRLEDGHPVPKIEALQELGFLKEHSLRQDMHAFHEVVQQAIEQAMSPGWD